MHVVFVELYIVVLSSVVTISNCSFNRDADDRSEQIQSEIGSEQIGVRGSTQLFVLVFVARHWSVTV